VEQPARLQLDDQALLTQWKPAYTRGTWMQAPLAVLGFALGLLTWWQTSQVWWLLGGVLLLANWLVTLLAIRPTNRVLLAVDVAGPHSRALIEKWGRRHAVRTLLGIAASLLFFGASL
jgi:hypothetical protein